MNNEKIKMDLLEVISYLNDLKVYESLASKSMTGKPRLPFLPRGKIGNTSQALEALEEILSEIDRK